MMKHCVVLTVLLVLVSHGSVTLAEPAPGPQLLEQLSGLFENWSTLQEKKAQTQTMRDCRNIGNALMAWVVDQLSAPSAGADVYDMEAYRSSSYEEMTTKLVPDYIAASHGRLGSSV